jgi:tRNA(Ile2)-agmatinylcytidine synthase
MWIGVDDTDSLDGGCTTYMANILLQRLLDQNIDIIGYPRLVRLNPNIPWKTRGNGAISFQIGKGTGDTIKIGETSHCSLYSHLSASPHQLSDEEIRKVQHLLESIIEDQARMTDKNTNPGFVMLPQQPSFTVYEDAVHNIVTVPNSITTIEENKGIYKGYNNKRGLIGATASIAWSPIRDRTYELITYRQRKVWGTQRWIDDLSVQKMDGAFPLTFDNYDYENNHIRIMPNSPCPILYGIRGDSITELQQAYQHVHSEALSSWILFETNQGTDDHLQKKTIKNIHPWQSVIVEGIISDNPCTLQGGHVLFRLHDSTGEIDCIAYEPTKQFRKIIRLLHKGDHVIVYGGVRKQPLTINLEKIKITHLVSIDEKIENPICPRCGKHMKSRGNHQGFKCIVCGIKSTTPVIQKKSRAIKTGWYEVPVCARRHLSKPLKRMKNIMDTKDISEDPTI